MKTLVVALFVLALACGGGYGWSKPSIAEVGPGASIGRVLDRHMYSKQLDVPERFRRLEDPISGPLYLLFDSRGYACAVSPEDFTMALDEDQWACKWRIPRGI